VTVLGWHGRKRAREGIHLSTEKRPRADTSAGARGPRPARATPPRGSPRSPRGGGTGGPGAYSTSNRCRAAWNALI
jgi:hypothetical protein